MRIFYELGLGFYKTAITLAAPFHPKARKLKIGQRDIFAQLKTKLGNNTAPVIWFHCASLGEFEQGRPVIENITSQYPQYKIVLTFFSPSGYEIRKNYSGAQVISYLPFDSAANARLFLDIVKPTLAVFVKYEFWYHYLLALKTRNIPAISVSAIFRPSQLFFKPYGGFYRDIIKSFTHIFTQNESSAKLLQNIGINQVTVAGDTRFDRVLQTASSVKNIPVVDQFKAGQQLFIIGSSWPEDMAILTPFIKKYTSQLKFIIAPHEIHEKYISELVSEFEGNAIQFSKADKTDVAKFNVLIIDNIGMLGSLYNYGSYGYVGGAFGAGLHNTLEPAVFGLPLFFGPTFDKFQEAKDLVHLQVGYPVNSTSQLENIFNSISQNPEQYTQISQAAKQYVQEKAGATAIIMQYLAPMLTQK